MLPSWTQRSKSPSAAEEKEGCHTTSQSNSLYGSTVPGQDGVYQLYQLEFNEERLSMKMLSNNKDKQVRERGNKDDKLQYLP